MSGILIIYKTKTNTTKEIGENGKLPVINNNDNNAQLIQGIKAIFKALFIFLPLPVFWTLMTFQTPLADLAKHHFCR